MAKGPEIKMQLENEGSVKAKFNELPRRVQEKGLKASATAGGTVLTRAVRRNVPRESGLLKKSINKKVKLYRNSETAVAIVGADKSVEGEFRGNLRIPAKYFAIVEKGAKPHGYKTRAGEHPGFEGKHIIEDAEKSEGGAALEAAQTKLAEVIEREAEKLAGEK